MKLPGMQQFAEADDFYFGRCCIAARSGLCNYHPDLGVLVTVIKISQVGRDVRRLPNTEFRIKEA